MPCVYINPGHAPNGIPDPGACGCGLRESDVAANVGAMINENLKAAGVTTRVHQSHDLYGIPNDANNWGADIFVSIHCNAFNGVAKGTEVCVYSLNSQGAALGEIVQKNIVSRLGTADRGLKERPGLCVLKNTDMPAILIEMAFIDNPEDGALLASKQDVFAKAISDSILQYANVAPASGGAEIAPNGNPYDENDVQYLLKQGYTRAAALSFLDTTDKYSNSDIQAAAAYAESRVGTTGYGNNGCTEWVRQFLLKANHWFGQLMTDGSQGNLMWVPNIYDYAKANGIFKTPEQGGAMGDICLLETNGDFYDGPDHVVIACGDGNYWGNSSSRNKIVKSSIARDYGASAVHGYVATGTGSGSVAKGNAARSVAEIVGDAGSTSSVRLSRNGSVYEQNDIDYLTNQGYSIVQAIDMLSKSDKYSKPRKIAPNGKPFEQNDIDYLVKQGYTEDSAIAFLSTADKYIH